MTVTMDDIIQIDNLLLTAIAEHSVVRSAPLGGLSFRCSKRPVAILMGTETEIRAYRLNGSSIELDRLEQLYPGPVRGFVARSKSLRSG